MSLEWPHPAIPETDVFGDWINEGDIDGYNVVSPESWEDAGYPHSSGLTVDSQPQASRADLTSNSAAAVRTSILGPGITTTSTEELESASGVTTSAASVSKAAIADAVAICSRNTARFHAVNDPVPTASEIQTPTNPLTSASPTSRDASPLVSTQPIDSIAHTAITAAIVDAMPPPHVPDDASGQTRAIANDHSEWKPCDAASPQGSASSLSEEAQQDFTHESLDSAVEPVTEDTTPEFELYPRGHSVPRTGNTPSQDCPIIFDHDSDGMKADRNDPIDDGIDADQSDNIKPANSQKQVCQQRQRYMNTMRDPLNELRVYMDSTEDDSGNYNDRKVGKKRAFATFIDAELDDAARAIDSLFEISGAICRYSKFLELSKKACRR